MSSRVLIVDDNSRNLQVLAKIVEDLGHDVTLATDGAEAIRAVTRDEIDVALLDIMMPGMDGYQVCRKLQQIRPVPVIFVTAKADPDSVARGFEAGAADYVTKPFHAAEVAARLTHQIQLQEYQRDLEESNRKLENANNGLKAALQEVERLAMTDPLTGLLNRRAIMERLRQEERRTSRYGAAFSLLMGDLDHFKAINDEYGHDCGDEFLLTVARVLTEGVRGEDVIARWGGEEFLVMLPQTGLSGAVATAEKLRESMARSRVTCSEVPLSVTMTFGVAEFDPDDGIESSINYADRALYAGKQAGRNCVIAHGDEPADS